MHGIDQRLLRLNGIEGLQECSLVVTFDRSLVAGYKTKTEQQQLVVVVASFALAVVTIVVGTFLALVVASHTNRSISGTERCIVVLVVML